MKTLTACPVLRLKGVTIDVIIEGKLQLLSIAQFNNDPEVEASANTPACMRPCGILHFALSAPTAAQSAVRSASHFLRSGSLIRGVAQLRPARWTSHGS